MPTIAYFSNSRNNLPMITNELYFMALVDLIKESLNVPKEVRSRRSKVKLCNDQPKNDKKTHYVQKHYTEKDQATRTSL